MGQVNMFHPAMMGLSNITRLYKALGNPAGSISAVHVAGTNGKVPLLSCVGFWAIMCRILG